MQLFDITNNKAFMASLLKTELFDDFEVREVAIHTTIKHTIDGTKDDGHISWGELRPLVYTIISGKQSPQFLKIVMSTNSLDTTEVPEDISTFFVNIVYKENVTTITTGCAYAKFTLDKSYESIWDKHIQTLLISNNFI